MKGSYALGLVSGQAPMAIWGGQRETGKEPPIVQPLPTLGWVTGCVCLTHPFQSIRVEHTFFHGNKWRSRLNTCLDDWTLVSPACLMSHWSDYLPELNAGRTEATLSLTQFIWKPTFTSKGDLQSPMSQRLRDGEFGLILGRADISVQGNKPQDLQASAIDGVLCTIYVFASE